MEIRLNLATATQKDAEHAIFLIGAYFGMVNLPHAVNAAQLAVLDLFDRPRTEPLAPAASYVAPVVASALAVGGQPAPQLDDAARVFGATPVDSDPTRDAADVFGGNVAGAVGGPVGAVLPQTPAPSAPIAAAPVGTSQAQPPAPVASVLPGVTLDKDGLPWDQRIHAAGANGAKPMNADGRWRAKRGVNNDAFVAAVQAELRAALAAPVPSTMPPAPAPQAPAAPAAPPAPPAPQVAVVPPTVPPVAPSVPAPPAAPSAPVDPTTFEQLMPRITSAVQAEKLPATALAWACGEYKLTSVPSLAQRPDLIPYVWAALRQQYPALQ